MAAPQDPFVPIVGAASENSTAIKSKHTAEDLLVGLCSGGADPARPGVTHIAH
jgi:hypothetical protein